MKQIEENEATRYWQQWGIRQWQQRQLDALVAKAQLLQQTTGRGQRWRRAVKRWQKAAMAVLIGGTLLFSQAAPPTYAAGAGFTAQTGGANPFNTVDVGDFSVPSFVDIDGDGDMDAFISGYYYGSSVTYYRNTGTSLAPTFTEQLSVNNPLGSVGSPRWISAPSFVDIDGDGDMDAFIGDYFGVVSYYENTGTPLAPSFTEQTGGANPFNGVDVGYNSAPSFVDIDGDGDMDAFIGESDGFINYYENTGTPLAPSFTAQTGGTNPFNGVDVGGGSIPSFVDIDGDGDMDAFIGEFNGTLKFYQNTGTPIAPVFAAQTGTANPFNGVDVGGDSAPNFVDIDGDGDMDAFIGEYAGNINYYQNTGNNTVAPTFSARTAAANPTNGIDVGVNSAPSFVDIDGDGDMDLFSGEYYGTIKYYQNTGNPLAATFAAQTGGANPLNGVNVGYDSAPSFVDIDGDGDMDAFIGESYGTINYYQNTGTPLAPIFTAQTGGNNPLNGAGVGLASVPSFVDIDGDGDMDAFIGDINGTIRYYQNTGTPLAPAFTAQTGAVNPLNGVDVGTRSAPTFVDIDRDGDMDAFIGESFGTIYYYQNTGTRTAPVFAAQTGGNNPFNGVDVGFGSVPSFVDIDGDGDMDAFIGESYGTISYFENDHCSFTSENSGALVAGSVFHFGNGQSRITVKVNSVGSPALTDITVSCTSSTHPNATANMTEGAYWTITPNAGAGSITPFNVELTMPFKNPVLDEDKLCRYTGGPGFGWECAQDSLTATTVTQNNVNAFSDWTLGDNVGPTAITLQSISATSKASTGLTAVLTSISLVLGGLWLRLRRRQS